MRKTLTALSLATLAILGAQAPASAYNESHFIQDNTTYQAPYGMTFMDYLTAPVAFLVELADTDEPNMNGPIVTQL